MGSFGVRFAGTRAVPSGEWTKVMFDDVLWDTAGAFSLERSTFIARRSMMCALRVRAKS